SKLVGLGIVTLALVLIGCNKPAGTPKGGNAVGKSDDGKKGDHAHGKGPNGGVVFDLGKYHAELDIKHDEKKMYILILDDDEKTPVAVAGKDLVVTTQEAKGKKGDVVKAMTIKLQAMDAKDGKASRYAGTDDSLGIEAEHTGTVIGEIDGKPSSGKFKEE